MTAFDTLKLSRQLRERAHFDQEQAEGVAEALVEVFQQEVATKTDIALFQQEFTAEIRLLRQDMQRDMQRLSEQRDQKLTLLEQRLMIRMALTIVVAIGILLVLQTLLERLIK